MTFTLDDATARKINAIAARMSKPKSEVVREAVAEYHAKSDRLNEAERRRMLDLLEEFAKKPSEKSQADVDRELKELRESRRIGWSRTSDLR